MKTHLYMKGFALGLALKQRLKATRNWLVFVHPELDWGNMLVGMQERSIHDIFVSKTQDVRWLTKQVTTLSDLARRDTRRLRVGAICVSRDTILKDRF